MRGGRLGMRGRLALGLLLASCGRGEAPPWAGTWTASDGRLSLLGTAEKFSGTGQDGGRFFTVAGTPPALSFLYADQTSEQFAYSQPDQDHLTLSNPSRVLQFVRDP